jgi:phosphonate transport system substrate-binding protein
MQKGVLMKCFVNISITVILFLSLSSAVALAAGKSDPDLLRVALLPDESSATVIKNNAGLKAYLEKQLGKKVEIVVTTDYSSMIEAMRHGRLDLAYFGPLSYVLAKSKSAIEPFAARLHEGSTTYQAVVVGNAAAGITKIEDIKGKNMAYGDIASTSSHLIPKAMLQKKGLEAKRDYEEHFVGSHDAVALAVQNGHAQAGGLSKTIFETLLEKKTIDPAKVKVIAVSDRYPEYPWAMRSDLAPALKEKIRSAFLSLKDKEVLKPLKADGFATVNDKDYDVIRDLAKILNLDLAKM